MVPQVALQERLTVEQFLHTCFPHPNLSEAIKEATLGLFSKAIHFENQSSTNRSQLTPINMQYKGITM
jgi:hypothetical protein